MASQSDDSRVISLTFDVFHFSGSFPRAHHFSASSLITKIVV